MVKSNQSKDDVCSFPQEALILEKLAAVPCVKGVANWIWHVPSHIVCFSKEWPHIMGYPEDRLLERLVSHWWPDKVHDDDINPFLEAARDIDKGVSENYQALFRVKRGDGSWAWLLSRGRVTEKTGGKPEFVSGVIVDVSFLRTDVKFQHGSAVLQGTNQSAMYDNSPDFICRMDRELFPLYINPKVSRYLARDSNGSSGGENASELGLDPQHMAFLQKNVDRVFEEGVPVRETVSFPTAYGHNVSGEYSFWPEFDAEGKVVAAMTQFRDITDQLLAERTARLNEMRLNALYHLNCMDNAPEDELLRYVMKSMGSITESTSGVLFFPPDQPGSKGRTVWSEEFHRLVGDARLPSTASLKEILDLLDLREGWEIVRRIRNGHSLKPLARPFGGKIEIFRYLFAPVFDEERVVCVAWVCNKGTEYKESDLQQLAAFMSGAWFILRRHDFVQKLQLAKEQAEAASKAMSEFLTNVNHELRTPLTSILGYAETLIQLDPEEEGFRNRCIEVIQQQAIQMHRLVGDLLRLSRSDGALPLNRTSVDLGSLVDSVVESLEEYMEKKDLSLCLNIPKDMHVTGDAHYLSQVLRNLTENAINYARNGTEIVISAAEADGEATISVYDEGASIDPEDLSRVFDRFYRGKRPLDTLLAMGTGVGLAICKQVVERHGGRIWAENVDNGVRVSFTLPG